MRMSFSKHTVLFAAAYGLSLLLFCGEVDAELNSKERVAAFAKLPDWTGLWEMGMGAPGGPPGQAGARPANAAPAGPPGESGDDLPYNAEWRAKYEAYKKKLDAVSGTEQIPDSTVVQCTWGFPRVMSGPYEFEVTVTPELTLFNYDIREFRHIWTDGRSHPPAAQRKLSSVGHSIGHWEGETLVVDTVGVVGGLWINGRGATLSDQAHFTERWTLADKDRLQAEVTVEDPVAFSKPYKISRQFKRITDTNRIVQQNCFENIHEVQEGGRVITKFSTGGVNEKK